MEKKTSDKRLHPRFESMNLLSFTSIDGKERIVQEGMGRTLNISEGGILIETHDPLDLEHLVLITLGLKEDLIEIKGRIVYEREDAEVPHHYGIQFIDDGGSKKDVLTKFIDAFQDSQKL